MDETKRQLLEWIDADRDRLITFLDCCDLPSSAEPYSIRSDSPTSVTPGEEGG